VYLLEGQKSDDNEVLWQQLKTEDGAKGWLPAEFIEVWNDE
jgi:hypothetical protein